MVLDSNLDILYMIYTTSAGVFQIRRYSNLKGPGLVRTDLTNSLLTASPTVYLLFLHTPYASTTLLVGTRLEVFS